MKALDIDTLSFNSNAHSLSRWNEQFYNVKLDVLPDFIITTGSVSDSSFLQNSKIGYGITSGEFQHLPDWLFVIFILSFAVLSSIQFRYYRYLELTILAGFNRRRIDSLHRNIDIKSPISEFLLFAVYVLVGSSVLFLITHVIYNLHFSSSSFLDFCSLFAFVLIIYLIKIFVIQVLGYVFSEPDMAKSYITYVSYHNRLLGLILLPFIFTLSYSDLIAYDTTIYIPLLVFLFIYIIRLYRGIQIFILKDVSILYLILYLCTLEILPLMLIGKALDKFL